MNKDLKAKKAIPANKDLKEFKARKVTPASKVLRVHKAKAVKMDKTDKMVTHL